VPCVTLEKESLECEGKWADEFNLLTYLMTAGCNAGAMLSAFICSGFQFRKIRSDFRFRRSCNSTAFILRKRLVSQFKTQKLVVYTKDGGDAMKSHLVPFQRTRPLVREGAPQRQDRKLQTELISGRNSHSGLDTRTY
jgi:hypothetical protein